MRDVLPGEVVDTMKRHLRERAERAQEPSWISAHGDEDTVTGDFCGQLRSEGWSDIVTDNGRWRWKCDYRRVRGRGPQAPEKSIGADVVVTIEVTDGQGNLIASKGLVVQAKKGRREPARLRSQIERIERLAPNSSGVFIYDEGGFSAVSGREVLTDGDNRVIESVPQPIGTFLGDAFVECTVGRTGLSYDDRRERVTFVVGGQLRTLRMPTTHRVRLKVKRSVPTTKR